jgi:hypothetical protein
MAGSGADALRHCYRIETRKRNENGTRVPVPVHFFKTGRNKGVELTAYSVRSCLAPASSSSSQPSVDMIDIANGCAKRDLYIRLLAQPLRQS